MSEAAELAAAYTSLCALLCACMVFAATGAVVAAILIFTHPPVTAKGAKGK